MLCIFPHFGREKCCCFIRAQFSGLNGAPMWIKVENQPFNYLFIYRSNTYKYVYTFRYFRRWVYLRKKIISIEWVREFDPINLFQSIVFFSRGYQESNWRKAKGKKRREEMRWLLVSSSASASPRRLNRPKENVERLSVPFKDEITNWSWTYVRNYKIHKIGYRFRVRIRVNEEMWNVWTTIHLNNVVIGPIIFDVVNNRMCIFGGQLSLTFVTGSLTWIDFEEMKVSSSTSFGIRRKK